MSNVVNLEEFISRKLAENARTMYQYKVIIDKTNDSFIFTYKNQLQNAKILAWRGKR